MHDSLIHTKLATTTSTKVYTLSDDFLIDMLTCVSELSNSTGYHLEELIFPDIIEFINFLVSIYTM
jgi:hypothetical protein